MNMNLKNENRMKIDGYDLHSSDGKVDFYPAYIQIEQTNRCNAECIMCNHFYLGNRSCNDLSTTIIEKIKPVLPYCETIMLNGDGEPFLCSSIEENINCFSEYGVKIGTNTNFCFVPDKLWQYFSYAFKFLNISCDGATADTFEMIRSGLKWEQFTHNLSKLETVAPELKKNFDCVVLKQNVKELPDIVRLAAEYGVKAVRFRRLGVNPFIGNEADQVEYYYSVLEESLSLAQEYGRELGVAVSFPAYQAAFRQMELPQKEEMPEEISKRKKDALNRTKDISLADDYYAETVTENDFQKNTWHTDKVCQWGVERCYIDVNGNVTTCCFNMKKNMGSLSNHTFDEIWNGTEYVEFRRLMAKHFLPDFCRECNWIQDSNF